MRSRAKVAAVTGAAVTIGIVAAYFGLGYAIYSRLANVRGSCDEHMANHPDDFLPHEDWPAHFDVTPYRMPRYVAVRFSSRQAGIPIAGWWVPAAPPAERTVILADGMGGCKASVSVLVPAGMLHRYGFNVLLIDLRDTGESGPDDGFSAIGNDEYLDVLGAWDWLTEAKGIPPELIGVFANSLGGAAALYAFSEETRIAALCLQSTFGNLDEVMREELRRNGYPAWLAPAAFIVGRLLSGVSLTMRDPISAVQKCVGRPIFIIHSRDDERIDVGQSEQLAAAAQQAGVAVSTWFMSKALHVQTPAVYPEEFAKRVTDFFEEHLSR